LSPVKIDEIFKGYGGEAHNKKNKDMSWMCEDQQVQPCSLSSSIYYGGQDIYPPPKSTQNSAFNPVSDNAVINCSIILYCISTKVKDTSLIL
jgi:hypothetical protein